MESGASKPVPLVIIFGSIHRVLKAESALKAAGIAAELIVTPRELSSDCGMVVRIPLACAEEVFELFRSEAIEFQKAVAERDGEYEEISKQSFMPRGGRLKP